MDEARGEVERILSSLGDRYTRYLPPAKYDSMVNAATGNLFGVGVELAQDKEGGRVIANDVEPTGPAFKVREKERKMRMYSIVFSVYIIMSHRKVYYEW